MGVFGVRGGFRLLIKEEDDATQSSGILVSLGPFLLLFSLSYTCNGAAIRRDAWKGLSCRWRRVKERRSSDFPRLN